MIKIIKEKDLLFEYTPEHGIEWIDDKLDNYNEVKIAGIFYFLPQQLLESSNSYDRTFLLGTGYGDYYKINKNILGLKFDLLVLKEMQITKNTFIAHRGISIFRKIDNLINEQIIIGGEDQNAIPISEFEKLLKEFPTTTELNHYAGSRISRILKDYLETTTDAQHKLENYLKREKTIVPNLRIDLLKKYEIQKYTYILDSVKEMLDDFESYSENDWQKIMVKFLLLIFPKYVAVLENVNIKDYYSISEKIKNRFIDLTIVDANGNIDIIEIKKPFANCLLSTNEYRGNYTPKKELSGSVMQVEKYLFHLNKWGIKGEVDINKKRSHELPNGMKIKITNPKAMIIIGRDNNFLEHQKFDFEIIKRKYANIIDIMTYDDLLRRLENIISSLGA